MVVAALLHILGRNQFELLGYTQVAEHRLDKDALKRLDVDKLKDLLIQTAFTTFGTSRLIKVLPNTPHSPNLTDDEQYPPGYGVPQWKLTSNLNAQVIALVNEGERYVSY